MSCTKSVEDLLCSLCSHKLGLTSLRHNSFQHLDNGITLTWCDKLAIQVSSCLVADMSDEVYAVHYAYFAPSLGLHFWPCLPNVPERYTTYSLRSVRSVASPCDYHTGHQDRTPDRG